MWHIQSGYFYCHVAAYRPPEAGAANINLHRMIYYFLSEEPESAGDQKVHTLSCIYFPSKRRPLGLFENCRKAVASAKRYYPAATACRTCCSECDAADPEIKTTLKKNNQ